MEKSQSQTDRARRRQTRDVYGLLYSLGGQHLFTNGGGCLLLYEALEVSL